MCIYDSKLNNNIIKATLKKRIWNNQTGWKKKFGYFQVLISNYIENISVNLKKKKCISLISIRCLKFVYYNEIFAIYHWWSK